MIYQKLFLLFVPLLITNFSEAHCRVNDGHAPHCPEFNSQQDLAHELQSIKYRLFSWGSCKELEEILDKNLIKIGCKTVNPHPHLSDPSRCFCPLPNVEDKTTTDIEISYKTASHCKPGCYGGKLLGFCLC